MMFYRSLVAVLALVAAATTLAPVASAQISSNMPPVISGSPKTTAAVAQAYSFQPRATDANGDPLRFSVANRPTWMQFDTATGRLYGTPESAQAGRTYSGIRIQVSDGKSSASLPAFAIAVEVPNRSPVMSGTPVKTATVGKPYAWKPTASDPDGDTLAFSVNGKPSWASFDTANGTLYGTPRVGNVGTYPNIVIRASDGEATTSLPAFTLTVSAGTTNSATLSWTAPTRNTDGSVLRDLAGYSVHYGTASRSYSRSVRVTGGATNSIVIEGLAAGTWYFAVKARNAAGAESEFSREVSKAL